MSVQYTRLEGVLMKGEDMASIRAVMYVGEQQIYIKRNTLVNIQLFGCLCCFISIWWRKKRARASCNE